MVMSFQIVWVKYTAMVGFAIPSRRIVHTACNAGCLATLLKNAHRGTRNSTSGRICCDKRNSNSMAHWTFLKRMPLNIIWKNNDVEVTHWLEVVNILFDVVHTLGGLGLPFRGHREKITNIEPGSYGVYVEIIKLLARHDTTLMVHIERINERRKYLSKITSTEIIGFNTSNGHHAVIETARFAMFFTIMADSTTDISHEVQMAWMLHFIDINEEIFEVKSREAFLFFKEIKTCDCHRQKDCRRSLQPFWIE